MIHKWLFRLFLGALLIALMTACAQTTPPPISEPAAPQPTPVAAQPTTAAPQESGEVKGTYYWVQETAWHPVHQLAQLAFLSGCEENGMQCKLATTDESGIDPWVVLADQTVALSDAAGFAFWLGGHPAAAPATDKANEKGLPVCMPHAQLTEGQFAPNAFSTGGDPSVFADPAAKALCDALPVKEGSMAITENTFNPGEDAVAKYFSEAMAKYCPDIKILAPEEEGPEPTRAIAKAVSIMQANPDLVAALSTTGGGATTWAGAQKETGKEIMAVGMDYTRVNLDLLKSGQIFGLVAQPIWDESKDCADLLYKASQGEEIPIFTVSPAPLITSANVDEYISFIEENESKMRPTPAP
jgi:ribose transport system substrate-binding protein